MLHNMFMLHQAPQLPVCKYPEGVDFFGWGGIFPEFSPLNVRCLHSHQAAREKIVCKVAILTATLSRPS